MNTTKRIVLACFLGASLGALCALQFNHYFWWLGILIGGGIGYLSYEFNTVISATKNTWDRYRNHSWAPMKKEFQEAVAILHIVSFGVLMTMEAVVLGFCWVFAICYVLQMKGFFRGSSLTEGLFGIMFILGVLLAMPSLMIGFFALKLKSKGHKVENMCIEEFCAQMSSIFIWMLPPPAVCWCLVKGFVKIPAAFKIVVRFTKHLFILIHSELRLLCMTDSLIGGLVGYYYGNAFIGGLAGAAFGVINYKLISVRFGLAKA